jgi:cyclohexyl-isocyanide hydratase
MNRREFTKALGALLAASVLPDKVTAATDAPATSNADHIHRSVPTGPAQQIAMLVYPAFTALDLVGPHQFLAALGNVQVHLVWKTKEIVVSDSGLSLQPTATLKECPANVDILFVPGGMRGTAAIMKDPEVLDFLHDRGQRAKYVTSVCTGSLVLGAAGLLRGYRATSHWTVCDLLPLLGAEPVAERVVEDRNRITGGGVTAGVDFGLRLAARLRDEPYAKMLQLIFEYAPQPPFQAGTPEDAGTELVSHVRERMGPGVAVMRQAALAAQKRLQG